MTMSEFALVDVCEWYVRYIASVVTEKRVRVRTKKSGGTAVPLLRPSLQHAPGVQYSRRQIQHLGICAVCA